MQPVILWAVMVLTTGTCKGLPLGIGSGNTMSTDLVVHNVLFDKDRGEDAGELAEGLKKYCNAKIRVRKLYAYPEPRRTSR